MECEGHHLPDFIFDPNRSLTFSDFDELNDCATKHKSKYVVRPILSKIPSLAIQRPKEDPKTKQQQIELLKGKKVNHFRLKRRKSEKDDSLNGRRRPCGCLINAPKSCLPKIFHKLSARKRRLDKKGHLNTSLNISLNESFVRDCGCDSAYLHTSVTEKALAIAPIQEYGNVKKSISLPKFKAQDHHSHAQEVLSTSSPQKPNPFARKHDAPLP